MNYMHKDLSDSEKKIEALYHLEVCSEPCGPNGKIKPIHEILAHVCAAHYIIQSMGGGHVPANYDEIIMEAKEFDAKDEANCAIHRARKV